MAPEDVWTSLAEEADALALITLRYVLADALELCEALPGGAKSEAAGIEPFINAAALQVMSMLAQTGVASATERATRLSTAGRLGAQGAGASAKPNARASAWPVIAADRA